MILTEIRKLGASKKTSVLPSHSFPERFYLWTAETLPPGSLRSFAFAAACVAAATGIRVLFGGLSPGTLLFASYYPAILVATLAGGAAAGGFAIALTILVVWWAFMPPPFTFQPLQYGELINIFFFVVAASLMVGIAEGFRRALHRLSETALRLNAFLENSAVIAWLKDEHGRHVFLSDNYVDRFGFARRDWKGKTDFELWPQEVAAEFQRNDAIVLAATEPIEVVEQTIEPDGKITMWLSHKFTFQTPEGRFVGGLGIDVTEREEAHRHAAFLLDELNHRVKNLLAVVISVAHQTVRASPPEEFVGVFSQRLQGLAASHELLFVENWRGVDMLQLAQQQFAPFKEFLDRRVTLAGPSLRLNATAVQAIGMAIHELATNAVKYGALSNETGHVAVNWTLIGEVGGGGATLFALSWIERNGTPVRKPSRQGFGHKLLTEMTAQPLSGEARLNYAKDGLEWTFECPADAVLDRSAEPGLGDLLKSLRREATSG